MTIVGIGGVLRNAACAVLRDGELLSAVEQSRLTRQHTPGELPDEAIRTALQTAKVEAASVDCVALARPLATAATAGPVTRLQLALRDLFPRAELVTVEHHLAHAASAYYLSPFDKAAVLTLDRAGDHRAGALWQAEGTALRLVRELAFPDSLGHLYSRVTTLLGFEPNSDEHKVQWLSAYGDDRFVSLFRELIGGSWPRLDRSYLDEDRHARGGFSSHFYAALGLPDNEPVPTALQPHVAAGLQLALEKTVAEMAGNSANLCLAGGVAFNALLVASLERERSVFVQPAAGNSGTALGAAAYAWHQIGGNAQRVPLRTLALGPAFSAEESKQVLENCKLRFTMLTTSDEMIECTVDELDQQNIVAWMQGRMEFGPRALGYRSILASPLAPYSTENLNVFIKHREPFRKFAASVPAELADEFFEVGPNARFLATVGRVKAEHHKTFEAAMLGDGIVRVHAVHADENPLYHRLLHAAGKRTGLPVLYNTSFNLFGDPLVCTPRDAVRSFYSSGIDALCVGNFMLRK